MQDVGADAKPLQHARPEILHENMGGRDQAPEYLTVAVFFQVDDDAALVAGIDFPLDRDVLDLPGA